MKKKLIFLIFPLLILAASCKKYVEGYDISPNYPATASLSNRLYVTEVGTFINYTGDLARISAMMVQQTAGTDFQYLDYASYSLHEGDMVNDWSLIYADAMVNAQGLIDSSGKSPYYTGIGEILKAMNLGLATDFWGDVPNRQALKALNGEQNFSPAFDPQQLVIQDIQSLLTDAIKNLSKAPTDNLLLPGAEDMIYNGDVNMWIQAAWALKARYANRLSKRDPSGSATEALNDIKNAMSSPAGDMNAIFGTHSSDQNQWAAFEAARPGYMRISSFFYDTMSITNDPRIPFYLNPNDTGAYSGSSTNTDEADAAASYVGPYAQAQRMPMVTYMEMKFIEAEANFRLGNKPEAATAYNAGVAASLQRVTGGSDTAYSGSVMATAANITLDMIMYQKYIALFTQTEVYSDWRRTGLPKLTPNPAGLLPGIPRRMPMSQEERTLNKNAIVDNNLLDPVWWDK